MYRRGSGKRRRTALSGGVGGKKEKNKRGANRTKGFRHRGAPASGEGKGLVIKRGAD